jgi:RNA polymerase sigma-70 factor (ECF subfamily)
LKSAEPAGTTATQAQPLPSVTDRELVRRAQAGDRQALVTLYRRYVHELYGYAYNQLGSVEDAEDLTSETFLRLVRAIDGYDGRSSFRTWIYVILRNQIRDHWRRNGRRPVSVPLEPEDAGQGGQGRSNVRQHADRRSAADMRAIENGLGAPRLETAGAPSETMADDPSSVATQLGRAVLRELPDNYSTVLRHRIMDGRSIRDTAEEMDTSEGNVKVLQHRALKRAAAIAADIESREGRVTG